MAGESKRELKPGFRVFATFIAGATAGGIAKTLIAPLDRTKINYQVTNRHFSLRNALKFLLHSVRTQGFFSLWRGNSASLARILPNSAIQFAAHDKYTRIFCTNSDQRFRRFLCGSLAGVTGTFFTYPLDLLRARMAVTNVHQYRSLCHAYHVIVREEGYYALYRGYVPTLLGSIPYSGSAFYTFVTLKNRCIRKNGRDLTPMERLTSGALAGLIGQTVSYPLDTVRRRLQTSHVTCQPIYAGGVLSIILSIYRNEGLFRGIFKGVSMNWIKGPIAVGTSFTIYEGAMKYFQRLHFFQSSV